MGPEQEDHQSMYRDVPLSNQAQGAWKTEGMRINFHVTLVNENHTDYWCGFTLTLEVILFSIRIDQATHHETGNADASQPWVDIVPHADAAPSDPLPHGQLQEEQGDPNEEQQDEIGHQIGSCDRNITANSLYIQSVLKGQSSL